MTPSWSPQPKPVVGAKSLDQRQHFADEESKTGTCALEEASPEDVDSPQRLEEFYETESSGRHEMLKGYAVGFRSTKRFAIARVLMRGQGESN